MNSPDARNGDGTTPIKKVQTCGSSPQKFVSIVPMPNATIA